MQQTTSSLITNFLQDNPPTTVKELSVKLNLTKADIRYHINKLIKSNIVKSVVSESTSNRGRPAARFTLVKSNLPGNLLEILTAFFEIHHNDPDLFANLGHVMADKMKINTETNLLIRLNKLMPKLNDRGYSARWETHLSGPVIFFQFCPYQVILENYPQLCKMDQIMLSSMLQKKIIQTHHCFDSNSKVCRFQIMNF